MAEAISGTEASEGSYVSPWAYRHYLLARIAETSGDLSRALDELEQATAYDSESAELRLALGKVHASLGNLDLAEQEMKRAIEALAGTSDEELRSSVERELRSLRMANLPTP